MMDELDDSREPIRLPPPPPAPLTAGPYEPFIHHELEFTGDPDGQFPRGFTFTTDGKVLHERTNKPDDGWVEHKFTLYPTGGHTSLVIEQYSTHDEGGSSSCLEVTENPADACWDVGFTSSASDCDGRTGRDQAGTSKGGLAPDRDTSAVNWGGNSVYDESAQRAGY